MTECYKDFYGNTASIHQIRGRKFRLVERMPNGRLTRAQTFNTHRGAVRAMNNDSDDWEVRHAADT